MPSVARRFVSSGCALTAISFAISATVLWTQPAFSRLPSCAQNSSPTQSAAHVLRSEVDVQTVNVQVKDKQGTNVGGLTANDFAVREDGEPQKITFFDAGSGPVTVEVLVDSSSSMVRKARLGSAEEIAARFMRIARPGDEIWAMDFTGWMGHFERITQTELSTSGPMVVSSAGGTGSAVYDAIAGAICRLRSSTNPRQAIIVITDGIDEHSRIALDQLIDLIRSQRAQLFLIGFPSRPEFSAYNHNEPKVTLVTGHDIDNPDVVFERLAKEAGAETFIPKSENGLQDALKAVSNLLDSEYTLAFYPPKTSRNVRRIGVKVDRSGVRVLTSRFVVAGSDASDAVHYVQGSCAVSPKFHPYSYGSHVTSAAGNTVYRDDFSDPNSGWPRHPDSDYVPGGYELTTAEPSSENPSPMMAPEVAGMSETTTRLGTYRDNVVASWGPTWWNFRASATMKAIYRGPLPSNGREYSSLPVQPAAGLVFRMNEKGYYALLLTSASLFKKNQLVSLSGDYKKKLAFEVLAMTFHVNSKTGAGSFVQSVVVPWIVVDHASATDARLAVQDIGDQITIFIDGRQVGSVRDDRFTEGTVGFTVWAPSHATFSNLLVEQEPASMENSQVTAASSTSSVVQQSAAEPAPLTSETNRVLVPVFVYDESQMQQAPKQELPCVEDTVLSFFNLTSTEPYLPKDCDVAEMRGLTVKDFRLYQDGVEQEIRSFNSASWWTVARDNLGWYMQSSFTPSGIWGSTDLSQLNMLPPGVNREFHLLGYVPAAPKEGCHHIRVEVDRPHALIFARDQYCTGQSPSDPLFGTVRAEELQRELDKEKSGKIPLTLQATAFYARTDAARVDVRLQFPWNKLAHAWDPSTWRLHASISVMGIVRKSDGSVAARFSDLLYPTHWPTFVQGGTEFAQWEKGTDNLVESLNPGAVRDRRTGPLGSPDSMSALYSLTKNGSTTAPDQRAIVQALSRSDPAWIPGRYETQIEVPPGRYTLQVVLSDEFEFGRTEVPLEVAPWDGKQLAMSSIALSTSVRDAAVAAKEASEANFAPQYVPLVSRGIEFTLAGDDRFAKSERLFGYFEVYEPLLASDLVVKVQAEMRIVDANTGKLRQQLESVDAAEYRELGSTALRVGREIPISELTPGDYRLEVRATDSTGKTTPWHGAAFSIE